MSLSFQMLGKFSQANCDRNREFLIQSQGKHVGGFGPQPSEPPGRLNGLKLHSDRVGQMHFE